MQNLEERMMAKLKELKDVYDTGNPSLRLFDTEGASKILGVTEGTLVVWRSQRRYSLAYTKIGRKVYYTLRDLLSFIESRRVTQAEPESRHIGKSLGRRRSKALTTK